MILYILIRVPTGHKIERISTYVIKAFGIDKSKCCQEGAILGVVTFIACIFIEVVCNVIASIAV